MDSVEAAVATATQIAGDKDVTIASPAIIRQALDLDLVDEVCISLVPVLFGEGIPHFSQLDRGHLLVEDPSRDPGEAGLCTCGTRCAALSRAGHRQRRRGRCG